MSEERPRWLIEVDRFIQESKAMTEKWNLEWEEKQKAQPKDHDWAWIPPTPRPWKARLHRAALTGVFSVILTGIWAGSMYLYSESAWWAVPVFFLAWGVSYEVARGIR